MDSMATALQKFGYSNGFRRGTFDSVNLIIYSMLAVIPFFDRNSAYLFSSYMFLFTALFELPTGISSDKYGANKSLLLGYWIIILGVIYLGYVSLSTNQEYIVADISIIISCGVIALGAAFCNGSFQSAYLQWFYNLSPKLERDSSNYLFSKSYKFGYKVEILLPVLCLLFGTIITNCLFEEETLENYYNFTVFMFSLLVFLLVFSYFIVNKDIKFNESYVQGSSVG
ncbi:hypothetical protein L8S13_25255, partial [Vibrio lentus]|uniref:hypothetical protein n=1 Tax=Vibrio lentus TaxID=136468 RepID=UPI002469BA80